MMASSVALLARGLGRAARRPRVCSGDGKVRSLLIMPGGSTRHPFKPHLRRRPSSSLGSLNFPHVAPDPLADPTVFDDINTFSCKRQTGVSLKTLLDTGTWREGTIRGESGRVDCGRQGVAYICTHVLISRWYKKGRKWEWWNESRWIR